MSRSGPPRPRGRPPVRLVAAYSVSVAALGLALVVLGPPPGPPTPLSPASVLGSAAAALPAGARDVRVLEVDGWRAGGRWRFAVYLAYREHGRLAGRSVLLPAPPVGAVLPIAVTVREYHAGWPVSRLTGPLSRLQGASCVGFFGAAAPVACTSGPG